MLDDTAIKLEVSRSGVIDSLARISQALHITAHFMRADEQERNAITTEMVSYYLEALAAGLEQDSDESIAQQLVPLVIGLAQAGGEEDLEERAGVLQKQVQAGIEAIGKAREEEGKIDNILVFPGNNLVH